MAREPDACTRNVSGARWVIDQQEHLQHQVVEILGAGEFAQMMLHNVAGWKELALKLAGWVISAAIILSLAIEIIGLLPQFVAREDYTAITVLVAVSGAIVAISQFRSTARERVRTRARMLAFVAQLCGEATNLLMRPVPTGHIGEIPDPCVLEPRDIATRKPHLDEIGKALLAFDIKELPSAEAMAAVVELRSVLNQVVAFLQALPDGRVNFDHFVSRLISASIRLGTERDKLYPTYSIGKLLLQHPDVERR